MHHYCLMASGDMVAATCLCVGDRWKGEIEMKDPSDAYWLYIFSFSEAMSYMATPLILHQSRKMNSTIRYILLIV